MPLCRLVVRLFTFVTVPRRPLPIVTVAARVFPADCSLRCHPTVPGWFRSSLPRPSHPTSAPCLRLPAVVDVDCCTFWGWCVTILALPCPYLQLQLLPHHFFAQLPAWWACQRCTCMRDQDADSGSVLFSPPCLTSPDCSPGPGASLICAPCLIAYAAASRCLPPLPCRPLLWTRLCRNLPFHSDGDYDSSVPG